MGAGTLALVCTWLLVGQPPNDALYTNQRGLRIPVNFQEARRSELRDLLLYASGDLGRNWQQVASITPEKDAFAFTAPRDGTWWLRVAVVDRQGKQDPENVAAGPPDQRVVIDTVKPVIRAFGAQRQGDLVAVAWEVIEENPDPASFRLEYAPKNSDLTVGTAIRSDGSLAGLTRFRPADQQAALLVRLTVRDQTGNESYAVAEVPGTAAAVTTANFAGNTPGGGAVPAGGQFPAPPTPPAPELSRDIPLPTAQPSTPPAPSFPPAPAVARPIETVSSSSPIPPAPPAPTVAPEPARPAVSVPPPAPAGPPAPVERVIADTKWGNSPPTDLTGAKDPAGSGLEPAVSAPRIAGASKRPLPPVQYINVPEFTMEYELSRIGPSGVGSVELWLTRNDGQTWQLYAKDEEVKGTTTTGRHQRTIELLDGDGLYGFTLVVKSRAGLGRNPPRAGDIPEIRVQLDTAAPEAHLIQPAPDPQKVGHLLLKWVAKDLNMAKKPISLEWAETREGPWQPIAVDLENTGRHSWELPKQLPVHVFLRLRVKDLAGNESIPATPLPELVDLSEPEGRLINVSIPPRR